VEIILGIIGIFFVGWLIWKTLEKMESRYDEACKKACSGKPHSATDPLSLGNRKCYCKDSDGEWKIDPTVS
jgi:hypothetical protein